MAKIIICTNDGEVFEIIKNVDYPELVNQFRWSVLKSQIRDGLERALNAENKVDPNKIETTTTRDNE